jgi:RNA polymerase sigma-70 factor (ECF subfamily)
MPGNITPIHALPATPVSTGQAPLSMDAFLAQVERRAYRTALMTTKRAADALDIVQDAMLQLVQYYRARPAVEWPLLFQRILNNRLMDWHRQQTRQRKWFWQSTAATDEEGEDPLLAVADEKEINPADLLARARDIDRVINILEALPLRQRQAFMLRAWEGFDVATTAQAMECSEGSVKTHYFRALQSLRAALSENEPVKDGI